MPDEGKAPVATTKPDAEPSWNEILLNEKGHKILTPSKANRPPSPPPAAEPAWSDILLKPKVDRLPSEEEQLQAESDARRRRRVEMVEKAAREKAAAKSAMRQAALTARCAIKLQALARGRKARATHAQNLPLLTPVMKADAMPVLLGLLVLVVALLVGSGALMQSPQPAPLECKWSFPMSCSPVDASTTKCRLELFNLGAGAPCVPLPLS